MTDAYTNREPGDHTCRHLPAPTSRRTQRFDANHTPDPATGRPDPAMCALVPRRVSWSRDVCRGPVTRVVGPLMCAMRPWSWDVAIRHLTVARDAPIRHWPRPETQLPTMCPRPPLPATRARARRQLPATRPLGRGRNRSPRAGSPDAATHRRPRPPTTRTPSPWPAAARCHCHPAGARATAGRRVPT